MRAGLIATLAVAAAGCGIEPAVDVAPGWQLVWHDEFDGAANATLDPDRWLHDVGGHGWGNRQLEFDTDRVENSSLDGSGHLVITARREAYGDNDYTSARITSRERFALTYGRFEARIRLPAGPGLWPAFWLLGENFPVVGWPECGEIDIMEHRGSEPTKNYGLAHGPGFAGGENIGGRYVLPEGARNIVERWFSQSTGALPTLILGSGEAGRAAGRAPPSSCPRGRR